MSLTTIVTVTCGNCGDWEYTANEPAYQRRRRGWRTCRENGRRRDRCPKCVRALAEAAS